MPLSLAAGTAVTVTPPVIPSIAMAPPPTTPTVLVPVAGPRGLTGPQGPAGPQGPPGNVTGAGGLAYTVSASQSVVTVVHGFTFNPAGITCIDTLGNTVEYDHIRYPVAGTIEITFGGLFSGQVFLS